MKVLAIVASGLPLGYVGCYGNDWIATPTLDRLAAEGIVFDQHIADHPETKAASQVWQTGRFSFPVPDGAEDSLPQQDQNLLGQLRERGIGTYLISQSEHRTSSTKNAGWTKLRRLIATADNPDPLKPLVRAVGEALQELESFDHWLLKVEVATLLPPWNVPEAYRAAYAELESEDEDETSELGANSESTSEDENETEAFLSTQASLAAAVSHADEALGTILDALCKRSLNEKVFLILTSDHGQMPQRHSPGVASQFLLREELIHIPLIVRLPGQAEAGRRIPVLTQPVDLLPTLLDLFSIPAQATQGHTFMPLILGKADSIREYACSGLRRGGDIEWALRTREWSFLLSLKSSPAEEPGKPRLYVKPDDRWDVNNVCHHHPELADRFEKTLRSFVAATRAPGPWQPPALSEITPDRSKGGLQS